MREVQSALRHHLDQIAEAELVAQIPAHTKDDHLGVKVSPSEQLFDAIQFAHRWSSTLQKPMYPTGRDHLHQNPRKVSVMAGTLFDRSRVPLADWFTAIWFMTNQKYGVSALGLQRLLGLGSYQTAWTMLRKLRTAMVRPGR